MFGDSDDLLTISLEDRTQKYKVIIVNIPEQISYKYFPVSFPHILWLRNCLYGVKQQLAHPSSLILYYYHRILFELNFVPKGPVYIYIQYTYLCTVEAYR